MYKYLIVSGIIDEKGKLVWVAGFEVNEAPPVGPLPKGTIGLDPQIGLIEAEWLDKAGATTWRGPIPLGPFCDPGGKSGKALGFSWVVPSAASVGGRSLRLYWKGKIAAERKLSDKAPSVQVQVTTGPKAIRVDWKAQTGNNEPPHVELRYTHDGERGWRPLTVGGVQGNSLEIPHGRLPGGPACQVEALVSDGLTTGRAKSDPFEVPEIGCVAMILSPTNGATFDADEGVPLAGQGLWVEDGKAEHDVLVWRSDLDGQLARGSMAHANLRAGTHKITLRAGGPRGDTAEVTIQVKPRRKKQP